MIVDTTEVKVLASQEIKSTFDKRTGFTMTWGRTKEEDPDLCRFGPLLLDVEISTICDFGCGFCYKRATPNGRNMTLPEFQTLLAKMPKTVQQIALGIGSIDGNPDLFPIMEHIRSEGIVPNITISGRRLDKATADRLAQTCGAVAVSRYKPKDVCYNAVKMLNDAGLVQVNIHALTAMETLDDCFELLEDTQADPRLASLNAIVFLSGKRKGRGTWLTPVPPEKYKELIDTALARDIPIGFDSCSCPKFLAAIRGNEHEDALKMCSEPCESGLFSAYVSVDGIYYPCSFADEAVPGIDLAGVTDFVGEIWNGHQVATWRQRLLPERKCPLFAI
jgi:MoaA/NifB/PqqE/SkfB family radical SAM enzyme